MAAVEGWGWGRGAFRGRVEARVGAGVDRGGGIELHVERGFGRVALSNQAWENQRFHFAHGSRGIAPGGRVGVKSKLRG